MQCARAKEQFFDLIDGELTPAMQQVLEHHLSVCESCKSELREIRAVYTLLNNGLPEVAPPPGFRASVLSKISEQPKAPNLAGKIHNWLFPVGKSSRAPAFGLASVAILCAVGVGSFLQNRHNKIGVQAVAPTLQGSLVPWQVSNLSVQNDSVLQSVHSFTKDGKDYHVFTLHITAKQPQTTVQSYIVQSDAALTDPKQLEDPTVTTAAPTVTIEPGTSYDVPVAVTSDVPEGKSMTYLAQWNDTDGTHQEVCFVPLGNSVETSATVSKGESLFDALATVSAAYGTTIIVSDTASGDLSQPISRGLDASDATINQTLADLTLAANHTFTRQNDGSFVVR